MNRIDRLFHILLLLQSRQKIRALDLARQFEVTERTIYRDMSALMQMGIPIIAQAGNGYSLMEGYFLPPLVFTPAEASAIFLGVRMLAASGNLPQEADSVLEKITTALPKRTRQKVTRIAEIFNFHLPLGKFDLTNPLLAQIQNAILDKKVLFVRYHSLSGEATTEREIEPNQLLYGNGVWYIVGYCRLRKGVRSFRLDRIESLHVLAEHFQPRMLENPPTQPTLWIEVRFPLEAARWIRERQHYGFQKEEVHESYVQMTYRVETFSEIRNWLLSWGAWAEVVSPMEIRTALLEEAKKLVALLT